MIIENEIKAANAKEKAKQLNPTFIALYNSNLNSACVCISEHITVSTGAKLYLCKATKRAHSCIYG